MSIFITILLICIAALSTAIAIIRKRHEKVILEKSAHIDALYRKNQQLAPYQQIIDVEEEVTQIRHSIREEVLTARAEIKEEKKELRELKRAVREKGELLDAEFEERLSGATIQARRIIVEAEGKAEEVAGDAYRALREKDHLQETAEAMRNVIEGYGEEYLIPNHSVLEGLAEEYSHKDAGVELKKAIERTQQMVKSGVAATCAYVEDNRREAAIHFVLDAFNGKVDAILAQVKHNNLGKLDQQIQDAFRLVNHNGTAFRDAGIFDEYLDARRTELKWAVAVNELKIQERDEQRRIKQEMREEEKARREYEKARKQAEKEEKLLQQAMERVRAELAEAHAEKRAEFERQLQDLEGKLHEAEEKNQRAISLAQQTKRGHVYVISNVGSFGEQIFKIGLTRRLEPLDRVKELGDASVPFEFDVHAMLFSEDAPNLETTLHKTFSQQQVNKVNPRKEFFKVGLLDIKRVVEQMNISAKWTMAAEAREYRETLAMERVGSEVPEPIDLAPEQSPVQPETRVDPENAVPCPRCSKDLDVSNLAVGSNICPHCNGEFEVEP